MIDRDRLIMSVQSEVIECSYNAFKINHIHIDEKNNQIPFILVTYMDKKGQLHKKEKWDTELCVDGYNFIYHRGVL